MRWIVSVILFCAGLLCLAQAQVPTTGAGTAKPGAVAGYTGPGDIVTFAGWWGLRAYSAAKATALAPSFLAVDVAQVNTGEIHVKSDGTLNTTDITNFIAAHGTCVFDKFHDQTGNFADLTVSSATVVCPTTTIGFAYDGATQVGTATFSLSQPFAIVAVYQDNTTGDHEFAGGGSGATDIRLSSRPTDQFGIYAGGVDFSSSANNTHGAFHVVYGVFNGNSSLIAVDGGTPATGGGGQPGTDGLGAFAIVTNGVPSGFFREIGVIAGASTINSTLTTNMKTFWGIP